MSQPLSVFDPSDAPTAAVQSALADLLRQVIGAGVRVTITIEATHEANNAAPAPSAAPVGSSAPRLDMLTPMQRSILGLLFKDKPMKAEVLAMRLGKKCGGSFRSMCADLVRMGLVTHQKCVGYFLA